MTYTEQVCAQLGVVLTREQIGAARYLESVGQRFLVDFGYGNAGQKAMAHWLNAPAPKTRH